MIACPSDVIFRHLSRARIESQAASLRQCPEQSFLFLVMASFISVMSCKTWLPATYFYGNYHRRLSLLLLLLLLLLAACVH